jgi:hypothetical protein
MYSFDFTGALITLAVIIALIVGAITWGATYFSTKKKEIVVSSPMVPEIRLTTDGKKIDTVYVYKIPR